MQRTTTIKTHDEPTISSKAVFVLLPTTGHGRALAPAAMSAHQHDSPANQRPALLPPH
jgi:hypothetical protein